MYTLERFSNPKPSLWAKELELPLGALGQQALYEHISMVNQGAGANNEYFSNSLRVVAIKNLVDVGPQPQITPHATCPIWHFSIVSNINDLDLTTDKLPVLKHSISDLLMCPLQLG
jgi:hypothetical protein